MRKSAREAFKDKGIKGFVQYGIQKAAGIQQLDERLNTLNYFLNHYCNISDFPRSTGDLRLVQKGDTLLLGVVDQICRKNNLDYWIDAGTCLGAVRHAGFIPWDDDMDICMMRDVYERAIPILRETLAQYGIRAEEEENEPISRIGIGYKHKETGIWIDLLPAEYTTIDPNDQNAIREYEFQSLKYQRKWHKMKEKLTRQEMFEYRKRYIPEICGVEKANSIIYCPEFGARPRLWDPSAIFPVKDIQFEGMDFSSPNKTHEYLLQFYGLNYMGFPQAGLAHHGDDRGALITWSKQTGTDLNTVVEELETILKEVRCI